MTVAAGKDGCHCDWMAADNRHRPTAPPALTVPRTHNPAESGLDRILISKNTEASLVFRLNSRADWDENELGCGAKERWVMCTAPAAAGQEFLTLVFIAIAAVLFRE